MSERATFTRVVVDWNGHAVGENRRLCYSRRTGRAFLNPKYVAFRDDLAWTIKAAAMGRVDHAPRVQILMDAPRLDVDALVKAILDAVQVSGVVENDRAVVAQSSERARRGEWYGAGVGPHWLRIVIEEARSLDDVLGAAR